MTVLAAARSFDHDERSRQDQYGSRYRLSHLASG
jgi:hypothetical protein